jgi:hypothetical protein
VVKTFQNFAPTFPKRIETGRSLMGPKSLTYTLVYSKKSLTSSVETAITTHLRVRTPLNNLNPNPKQKTPDL